MAPCQLRSLTDAYRTLQRTVPDAHRSPELDDVIDWLGATIRQTAGCLLRGTRRGAARRGGARAVVSGAGAGAAWRTGGSDRYALASGRCGKYCATRRRRRWVMDATDDETDRRPPRSASNCSRATVRTTCTTPARSQPPAGTVPPRRDRTAARRWWPAPTLFGDHEATRQVVPRVHRPVPQKRPPAFDHCGVVDAAAAGQSHQARRCATLRVAAAPAAVQRTHQQPDGAATAKRSPFRYTPPPRPAKNITSGTGCQIQLRVVTPLRLGHHHREVGAAAGEVAGAVHRVDHPGEAGGRQLPKWRRVGVHAFFTHHEAAGVFAPEDVGQHSFCQPVGHRDQVTRALLDDLVIGGA